MSSIVRHIRDLCSSDVSESALYERAADVIYDAAERYNWVGIYKVDEDDLVLAGWRGPRPTKHVRIPLSQGICGFAATHGQTVIVDDVRNDPRYLSCFESTRSEIVVPILASERIVAEIDIDSDTLSAFSQEDRETLEQVAAIMGTKISELRS